MPPILAFGESVASISPVVSKREPVTLIEVSRPCRATLEDLLAQTESRLTLHHLPFLRALRENDVFSSDLALLIEAIERGGAVYVRFL